MENLRITRNHCREHLSELSSEVVKQKAHLGIAVDPDVDRFCFVCEDGACLVKNIHLLLLQIMF